MQFGQVECALHCGFHWLPGDGEISVAAKWDMVTDQFKTEKLSEKGLLKQHRCCCRYLSNPLFFKTRGKSSKKITQNPAIQFAGPVWIVVCSLGAL